MFKEYRQIYRYRAMLENSVRKELRARYKGSVFGFLWTFINPLLQLLIYSLVFNTILKAEAPDNANYSLWLFVAIVPWTCINSTIVQSTTVIVANGALIKKIYFPRVILPLSLTVTNLVNMFLTYLIVIATAVVMRAPFTWAYLALPLLFVEVFIFVFAISVLLSGLTVYFRDLEHLTAVFTMLWFYLSPIVYPFGMVENRLSPFMQRMYKANPVYSISEGFREIVVYGRFPDLQMHLLTLLISVLLLMVASVIFNRCQRRFAEEI